MAKAMKVKPCPPDSEGGMMPYAKNVKLKKPPIKQNAKEEAAEMPVKKPLPPFMKKGKK